MAELEQASLWADEPPGAQWGDVVLRAPRGGVTVIAGAPPGPDECEAPDERVRAASEQSAAPDEGDDRDDSVLAEDLGLGPGANLLGYEPELAALGSTPAELARERAAAGGLDAQLYGTNLFGEANARSAAPLAAKFGVPPFTVLDQRGGPWRERKDAWLRAGVKWDAGLPASQEGLASGAWASQQRHAPGAPELEGKVTAENAPGWVSKSIFDPVLAEAMLRWFGPPRPGAVLDPFAGECVKGIITGLLGYSYLGVDIRPGQVAANAEQAERLVFPQGCRPVWAVGDSAELAQHVPASFKFNMLLTSPPYYSLEEYGGGAKDGSGLARYEDFIEWQRRIYTACNGLLASGSFVVVKVGDVRGPNGALVNFVHDTVRIWTELGLHYWNDIVLVAPVGTMAIRGNFIFSARRKLVRGHQHVLVFWKGDPKDVRRFDNPAN